MASSRPTCLNRLSASAGCASRGSVTASVSGEYGFVDHQPVFANARAVGETVLFHISYENFERFLSQHHDAGCVLCRNLIVELVRRLRAENESLDLFAFPSAS